MLGLLLRLLTRILTSIPGSVTPGRALLATWRSALARHALREVSFTRFPSARLLAEDAGLEVAFDTQLDGREDTGTRITVARRSGEALPLELRRESWWTEIEKRRGVREFEIGDANFDDAFYIRGEPRAILAHLDALTRRAIFSLALNERLEIARNRITVGINAANEGLIADVLGRVLGLARQLVNERTIVERLATNAVHDPVAGVRLNNAVALALESGPTPIALEALRSAASDVVPEIRLRASIALGEEGVPELARLAADTEVADECAAQAVSSVGSQLGEPKLRHILKSALRRRRIETAVACLEVLADGASASTSAQIASVLAIENGRVAIIAARALGSAPSPAAERALVDALESADADVRLAAADSLGRVGTVASVASLQHCAWLHTGEKLLESTIRQAIAEIQARQVGAEPGQLSLAASTSGALSLSEEAGRLSLADAEGT